MKDRLIIVGAGGHGKVIADIAIKQGYTNIAFLDDNATGKCLEFPILGSSIEIPGLDDGKTSFVIAIGNNLIREKVAEKFSVNWVTLVHPTAQIGYGVNIGNGTVIMAGAIINSCAQVGKHCIINTGAIIEHDNKIEDYVHISPNASLGGTVHVGQNSHIGIGATVKNNINISENVIVGAGAVVVTDLVTGTYVGVPARRLY